MQEEYTLSGAELDWQAAVGTGTLADEVKDQALRDTALYTQVELWAEQYGYTLTQEDQASLEQEWQEQTAGGEEMALRQLESQGLTRERAEKLASVGLLYAGLYRMCQTEGSPLAPTQEELQAFAVQQGIVTVDRIFYPAGEDADAAPGPSGKGIFRPQWSGRSGGGVYGPGLCRGRSCRAPDHHGGRRKAGPGTGGGGRCPGGGAVLRNSGDRSGVFHFAPAFRRFSGIGWGVV